MSVTHYPNRQRRPRALPLMAVLCLFIGLAALGDVRIRTLKLRDDEPTRRAYNRWNLYIWGSDFRLSPLDDITLLSLANDRISYVIVLHETIQRETGMPLSQIGMPKPSGANWHGYSFLKFSLKGIESTQCNLSLEDCREGPQHGSATIRFTQDSPVADLKLTLRQGEEHLRMDLTPRRGSDNDTLATQLIAYPSSHGGSWLGGKKLRRREALTPCRQLPMTDRLLPLTPQDRWILLYDRHFDVARQAGEGPCALALDVIPELKAHALVGNYACTVNLRLPATRTLSLYLWDFHNWPNQLAMDYLKQRQPAVAPLHDAPQPLKP